MKELDNFAVFILSHGRPDRVFTYQTLKDGGYTGKICIVVDDLDETVGEYEKNFPGEVVVFDKKEIAKTFDQADNFSDMRSIVYARNASFKIAEDLGVRYFVQLDDDYTEFKYRFNTELNQYNIKSKNIDDIFKAILSFYKSTNIASVALAQGGDFIGGSDNTFLSHVKTKRKCMNSFFCSTERPFQFVGRINEDVNSYTYLASKGAVFLTINQVSLDQAQTQTNPGGMADLYLDSGTYIKSFYTVMFQPSSVKIREMGDRLGRRLHHSIAWDRTVPKILRETVRKGKKKTTKKKATEKTERRR